jgi:hypothetical protein
MQCGAAKRPAKIAETQTETGLSDVDSGEGDVEQLTEPL